MPKLRLDQCQNQGAKIKQHGTKSAFASVLTAIAKN